MIHFSPVAVSRRANSVGKLTPSPITLQPGEQSSESIFKIVQVVVFVAIFRHHLLSKREQDDAIRC